MTSTIHGVLKVAGLLFTPIRMDTLVSFMSNASDVLTLLNACVYLGAHGIYREPWIKSPVDGEIGHVFKKQPLLDGGL